MIAQAAIIPYERLIAFCRRWRVARLELFGSVTRDDFDDESDVDVLISFKKGSPWRTSDMVAMEDELEELVGRDVDLVPRSAVECSRNPVSRYTILNSAKTIYSS